MGWMDTMNAIVLDLEEKNKCVEHMFALTKDLERALQSNDTDGVGLALELRQEEIDAVERIDKQVQNKVQILPDPLSERVKAMLIPGASEVTLETPLEYNIFDTNHRVVVTMRKLITLDTTIRNKVERK